MADNRPCVYKILCPVTNDVVYVGCTSNPKVRFAGHFHNYRTPVGKWISDHVKNGLTPQFEVIRYFDLFRFKNQCAMRMYMEGVESYWMTYYHRQGLRLFNKNGYAYSYTPSKFIEKRTA